MILKMWKLYVIASLRTMFSDIKNEHLKHEYDTNFISKYTQNVHYHQTLSQVF